MSYYLEQEEFEIERNRVYVGDVCRKTKNGYDKEREQVIFVNFGEYYVEFSNIKNKLHLNKLQVFAVSRTNLSQENINFLSTNIDEANPYFVVNIKKYFNQRLGNIDFKALKALAYYLQPNADCSF